MNDQTRKGGDVMMFTGTDIVNDYSSTVSDLSVPLSKVGVMRPSNSENLCTNSLRVVSAKRGNLPEDEKFSNQSIR